MILVKKSAFLLFCTVLLVALAFSYVLILLPYVIMLFGTLCHDWALFFVFIKWLLFMVPYDRSVPDLHAFRIIVAWIKFQFTFKISLCLCPYHYLSCWTKVFENIGSFFCLNGDIPLFKWLWHMAHVSWGSIPLSADPCNMLFLTLFFGLNLCCTVERSVLLVKYLSSGLQCDDIRCLHAILADSFTNCSLTTFCNIS